MLDFYNSKKWKVKRLKTLKYNHYQCQECKRYGKNRTANIVHHIHPLRVRPDLALITWNLISLCNRCHEKMHDRTTDELTALGIQWVERIEQIKRKMYGIK